MKKEYPQRFAPGQLQEIFGALPGDDQRVIQDFLSYCSMTAGPRKLGDIKRNVVQFLYLIETPCDQVTLAELRAYLALLKRSNRKDYTTNGIKATVKRFLAWRFKDWPRRFDDLRDIKLVAAFNHEKINEGTLLQKRDIVCIMDREVDLMKKTFFITLYESGARPQELRQLRWADVRLQADGNISELFIFSKKTRHARTVYVKESTFYLRRLAERKAGDYVFPSRESVYEPIAKNTACRWIKEMGRQAIGRDIFPYLLRHSRATELYGVLPTKVAQKFLGHKGDMSDLYEHLSSSQLKEKLTEMVYKFDELPPATKEDYENRIENLEQEAAELRSRLDQWELRFNTPLVLRHLTSRDAPKLAADPSLKIKVAERDGKLIWKKKG